MGGKPASSISDAGPSWSSEWLLPGTDPHFHDSCFCRALFTTPTIVRMRETRQTGVTPATGFIFIILRPGTAPYQQITGY